MDCGIGLICPPTIRWLYFFRLLSFLRSFHGRREAEGSFASPRIIAIVDYIAIAPGQSPSFFPALSRNNLSPRGSLIARPAGAHLLF